MQRREVRLAVGVLLGIGALLVLGVAVGSAAPTAGTAVAGPNLQPVAETNSGSLQARRLISVPFGISPTLTLFAERNGVEVTGHGVCTSNGTVDIQVFVDQDLTHARAMGWRQWDCPKQTGWNWTVHADVIGPWAMAPSDGQVCAIAVVRPESGPTQTFRWCRDDVSFNLPASPSAEVPPS